MKLTHYLCATCHQPPKHPPLLTKVGRGPKQAGHSLSGGMGPLSMLPPWPGMLQKGGAQPRKQWQFWLLLQTWSKGRAKVSAPWTAPASHRACPPDTSREEPQNPPPPAHVPRGHCTSSHSLPFQRRRCFCTAPRSKSVVRRKLNCEHNGHLAINQETGVSSLEYMGLRRAAHQVSYYSEKLKTT